MRTLKKSLQAPVKKRHDNSWKQALGACFLVRFPRDVARSALFKRKTGMTIKCIPSDGACETKIGYCRAVVAGGWVHVAGTL
jgi:hypothetical protein